jgi:hypothetical protein
MRPWILRTIIPPLLLLAAAPAFAQFYYVPYYGKNKVIYEKFNWKSYPTEHFKIYSYSGGEGTLKDVAGIAESAYQRISRLLKHQLAEPVPLIYYRTFTDFEQTNLFEVSEGVLGVSEPILHRIGIHGDMPLDELQSLVEHELTHIFEFDILWGDQAGSIYSISQPPLWVFEGLSEFATRTWSSWSSLIVRDAVLNDRIPEFSESGEIYSRYPLPREPAYDFGHAVYEYVESKFGLSAIREFWLSLKTAPTVGKRDPIQRAFNMKTREFQYEFKKYLRERNKDFLARENPENYSITLGPEFPVNPYYFAFSHALSPSGDIVATLTFNVRDLDMDLVLISAKDGSIIRNITRGYTLRYENIKYDVDPSMGPDLAWSHEGDRIAFFARDGRKHALVIVDPLTGKTLKKMKLPVDQPSSPSFLPSDDGILCAGFGQGRHDIFSVRLTDGAVTNLTNDEAFEKAPAVAPDGRSVAYTIRIEGYDKLFLSPLGDLKKRTQLTFGKGNTVAPRFSPDSKSVFFSGDVRGAYNIYAIGLETRQLLRYTDVRTGNFFPSPLPGNPKIVVFSSFNKGAFQIFKSELEGTVEGTVAFEDVPPDRKVPRFEPVVALDISKDKIQVHKGIGKLYLLSRPPIDAVVSTDGSIYGGSSVAFSDLLGDHALMFSAYQVRTFRSYNFAYLNQKHRFQYMASAFQYSLFYYPDYYYFDSGYYGRYFTYQDAIATRKISGISLAGYYPLNKYYRAEAGLGFYRYEEDFLDSYAFNPGAQAAYNYFWNGNFLQASLSLIGETTVFKRYGPAAGNTFRLGLAQGLPVSSSFFSNTNLDADARQYLSLGGDFLFAFRFEGFASLGKNPYFNYFGGNNQVRSSYYNGLIGTQGWWANAEFRFPLVDMAYTVLGQIGPLRGVVFADLARARIKGRPAEIWRIHRQGDQNVLKPYAAVGSYGYGFEFFFFGFPMHVEFVKGLHIPNWSKPFKFDHDKNFETNFWIGFDF